MKPPEESRSILTNQWFIGFICFIIGVTFVIGIILLLDTISKASLENKFYWPLFIKSSMFLFCSYFFLALLIYPISRPKTSIGNTIIAMTGIMATLSFMIIILAIVMILSTNAGLSEYYSTPKDITSYSVMESAFLSALAGLVIFIPTLLISRYLLVQVTRQIKGGAA